MASTNGKLTAKDKRAIKFLQASGDEKVDWALFAAAVGITGTELGPLVKGLLDRGVITEQDGEGSMSYGVVE